MRIVYIIKYIAQLGGLDRVMTDERYDLHKMVPIKYNL